MINSSKMARGLRKITGLIPVSFYQFLFRRDIFFFFYHVISDRAVPHVKHLYPYKSPEMFEHDLIYLLQNYNPVSYEQLEAHRQGRTRLKPKSAFLSFDDGYHECFTVVRPLLKKYGVPCTFFITTDLIDNQKLTNSNKVSLCIEKIMLGEGSWKQATFARLSLFSGESIRSEQDFIDWLKPLQFSDRVQIDMVCEILGVASGEYLKAHEPFMSLDELRTLASDGFTIGAHSKSHLLLECLTEDAIEQEIVESCQVIREITGVESIPFAFPFHGNGLKRRILEDICARHKVVGCLFNTSGIELSKGPVLDRIWADAPEEGGICQSNLPGLIYLAYQDFVLSWPRKILHIFPKGNG